MSRLIVKNIGKTTTEKQLRDLFGSKGEVTDVRILKTKSGMSRQFAFIGYRNQEQCQEAQKYFDKTYIQTSKMSVEIAKAINDPTLNTAAKSRHTQKKLQKEKMIEKKKLEEEKIAKKKEAKRAAEAATEKNKTADKSKLEFLEVMKARSKANVWGNDDTATLTTTKHMQQQRQLKPSSENESLSSDSEYDDNSEDEAQVKISKKVPRHESGHADIDSNSDNDDMASSDAETEESDDKRKGSTKKKDASVLGTASVMTDMDYLRAKMTEKITEISDSEDEDENDVDVAEESDLEGSHEDEEHTRKQKRSTKHGKKKSSKIVANEADSEEDAKHIDATGDSVHEGSSEEVSLPVGGQEEAEEFDDGRLFVRNLPFGCSEEELTEMFASYGPVTQVHLPLDENKRTKGIGFVQFMFPEHATTALGALDGTSFQGRLLHILPAKVNHPHIHLDTEGSRKNSKLSSFQQKKEEERKKMAGKKEGWNASYVRSEAVVDSLSERYGLSGGDILDANGATGGELAVRLAIGETHVLQDNREYFLAHGVDIDVLESALHQKKSSSTTSGSGLKNGSDGSSSTSKGSTVGDGAVKRSGTTILIKNLPHDLIPDELEDMFARFGSISSFLIPRSKTVALVDFIEPSEARRAFVTLAYRRYHHVPLYLEWAPMHTIVDNVKASASKIGATSSSVGKGGERASNSSVGPSSSNTAGAAIEDIDTGGEFSTLYVKNLNFESTEDDLLRHLTGLLGINRSSIRTVSIPKKQKNGHVLSMGFGFIEFFAASGASQMLNRVNGSVLHGHSLEAKPSNKRLSQTSVKGPVSSGDKKEGFNKLVVRNVAFQATKEELKELFSAFGAVKNIRIPRKVGGVHRGFAFVDFSSNQEAAAAMAALSSTHLYGRHLVIEYAKDDEDDLEKLREKAQQHATSIRNAAAAASRKRKVSDILNDSSGGGGGGGSAGGMDDDDVSMLYDEN